MSGIFSAKTNAATNTRLTAIPIQTSAYGGVIPVVYGETRLAGNLLWTGGFNSTPAKSSSGKGGGGTAGKDGSGTYNYTASLIFGLCEGPISGAAFGWQGQNEVSMATLGFSIADGAYGQAPWGYIVSNFPSQAEPYSGIAYAYAENYSLGTSGAIPSVNFEVEAILWGTGSNGLDADPSLVVPDILSNPHYGAGWSANQIGTCAQSDEGYTIPSSGPYTITVAEHANFLFNCCVYFATGNAPLTCVASSPAEGQYAFTSGGVYTFNSADAGKAITISYANLTGLTQFQNYCFASGLAISPAYTSATTTSACLDDIATFTNSEFVWSSGVLTVVPRGSVAITANGHTYTPPGAPLYSLTDDDFMPNTNATGVSASMSDDPVILTRSRISDQINDIKLEYLDRANSYAASVVEVSDQALMDAFGRRAQGSQSAHLFCDVNCATVSAQLLLQKQAIRNVYSFTLDARYGVLDPMDIVDITDSYLRLEAQPVRITEMTENDDGTWSVTAEEYPALLGVPAEYTLNQGAGYIPNFNVAPGNVNTPIFYEPPPALLAQGVDQNPQVWLAVSGASANWGGCDVYWSTDDATFKYLGTIDSQARMGALTASLPTSADPDTTQTLSVNLTESFGALTAGTTADANAGRTVCLVDSELISYSAATLTGAYNYNLTGYLRRGQFGSTIAAHSAGANFVRLDDTLLKFDLPLTPNSYVGVPLYFKFVSFNIYGGGEQSLASVSAYSYTPTGAGAVVTAPTGIAVTPAYILQSDGTIVSTMDVGWTASNDPLYDKYEVQYQNHGAGWTNPNDILIGAGTLTVLIKPVVAGQAYDFRVRTIRTASAAGGPFYSSWDEIDNITAVTKTGGVTDPTSIGGFASVLGNQVGWGASPDKDIAQYQIVRGPTASIGSVNYTQYIQATSYLDQSVTAGTAYYYWVAAVDTNGNVSGFVGPVELTALLVNTANVAGNAITNQVASFGYGTDFWSPCYVAGPGGVVALQSPLIETDGYTVTIESQVTVGNAINPSSNPGPNPTLNGYPFDAPAQIILDVYRINFGTGAEVHVAGVVISLGGGSQYTDPSTGVTVCNGVANFSFQDTPAAGGWVYGFNYTPYGALTTGAVYNIPFSNFVATVLELKR